MKIIICKNYEELSSKAAEIIASQIKEKPASILGLATGSTPEGTYKELCRMHRTDGLDFSKASSFNLDEYLGLDRSHDQSYYYFMNHHLFSKVNFKVGSTHLPNGMASDMEKECLGYEASIEKSGGIDLQLLGIGHNGHVGFNEPDSVFSKATHIVSLTPSTIEANARFFSSKADVPQKAVTMGIGTIMAARKVLLVASGKAKAEIIKRSVKGDVTPAVPASILQFHPDAYFVLDEEAASLL